jgi:protein subunit release factor B
MVPEQLRRLARECDIEPYRSSGPGGQKKNKTESSVRVRHRPTGLVRIATESRSQARNRIAALERIALALAARARRRPPRVPTRPHAGARERRLERKRVTGEKKRLRRLPEPE